MRHRFFITGGFGYLGSSFAKEALRRGHSVIVYDALIHKQDHRTITEEIEKDSGEKLSGFIFGDTRNKELLSGSLKLHSPTMVLHFAELVGFYACEHSPILTKT